MSSGLVNNPATSLGFTNFDESDSLVSNVHRNDWMQPSRSSCFCYERKQKLFRRSGTYCFIVAWFHLWGNLWVQTAVIFDLLWFLMQACNVTCKFIYLERNHKSLAIWGFPFQLDVHAGILSATWGCFNFSWKPFVSSSARVPPNLSNHRWLKGNLSLKRNVSEPTRKPVDWRFTLLME